MGWFQHQNFSVSAKYSLSNRQAFVSQKWINMSQNKIDSKTTSCNYGIVKLEMISALQSKLINRRE
jgi:hypothetical protein